MKTFNKFEWTLKYSLKKARRLNLFLLFLWIFASPGAIAQLGVHTDTPDPSSAMDIVASDRGLLIPRVTLTSTLSNPSPVSSPATGLLVFNQGANQPVGFYYWNGSQWTSLTGGGSGGGDYWSLTGNSGTIAGTNFLGTTDDEDLAFYTNNSERIRIQADGQVVIGNTTPYNVEDLVTIDANTTQDRGLSIFSPDVGLFTDADYVGVWNSSGQFGILSLITYPFGGYAGYFKNYDANGYGLTAVGSGGGAVAIGGRSCGLTSSGNDGLISVAQSSSGTGVIGNGNNYGQISSLPEGTGGAFKGYHGVYGKGADPDGIGVIGVGNNESSYAAIAEGSGGAFSGYHGAYAKAINPSVGTGFIGVGNNGSSYATIDDGSGGAFIGHHGVYAKATNNTGIGIIAVGNGLSSWVPVTEGAGGAFTGYDYGVYGYASKSSGDRAGAYFVRAGGYYAYVAARIGTSNRKIVGNGSVSTIVKNTRGELVTLVCPEAPETVFQDFGTGRLVDGKAHIKIDPDLSINIIVNEQFPLKVYITPEGDCNGVYVTNKNAEGFDVVELQGGTSNVPFSWQIVAQRANELYELSDGTIEESDYSQRWHPAPPPLDVKELKSNEQDFEERGAIQSEIQRMKEPVRK